MSTLMTSRTLGLCLESLDVLFFRDGRPFGAATRASSGQPMPQTLAGAIWTALLQKYGCDFRELAREVAQEHQFTSAVVEKLCGAGWIADVQVRGPWLALQTGDTLEVLTPMPALLHARKKGAAGSEPLQRLGPLPRGQEPPGWQPFEPGLRPLWLKSLEPTEAAPGYLKRRGLQAFLDGGIPKGEDVVRADDLFGYDHRTGIEIAADQLTAREGMIYGVSLLVLQKGISLYTEVKLPDGSEPDPFAGITTLAFGGEGRRVAIRPTREPITWPRAEPQQAKQKPLVVLTTPGLFAAGWKPDILKNHLIAAAVPGSVAVSGWDLARGGPKPTRFAAVAGSSYLLETSPPHLPDCLADRAEDQAQGWGHYVKGVWIDE